MNILFTVTEKFLGATYTQPQCIWFMGLKVTEKLHTVTKNCNQWKRTECTTQYVKWYLISKALEIYSCPWIYISSLSYNQLNLRVLIFISSMNLWWVSAYYLRPQQYKMLPKFIAYKESWSIYGAHCKILVRLIHWYTQYQISKEIKQQDFVLCKLDQHIQLVIQAVMWDFLPIGVLELEEKKSVAKI